MRTFITSHCSSVEEDDRAMEVHGNTRQENMEKQGGRAS